MKIGKRVISIMLMLSLVFSMMPNVFAASDPFGDVKSGSYYYDSVLWAVNHDPQITNGTAPGTFSPNETCTRGQVVTFLWRAEGCPEPSSSNNPFEDVKASDYYCKAVLWAVENDITVGTSPTEFSPKQVCTRAQVATFLYRYNGGNAAVSAENPFTDVKSTDYFYAPVLWAVKNGITVGTGKTTFSPKNDCTRAQIVTFLYRAVSPDAIPDLEIASHPQSAMVNAGETLTLSVNVTGGVAPYSYQWKSGGVAISGATYASYTTGEAGIYTCTVTDARGKSVTSSAATITVNVPDSGELTVTRQPIGGEIAKGSAITFSVGVGGGTKPYTYQWYKDGLPISGATFLSYVATQAGSYFCAIYDATGYGVISSIAIVSIESVQYEINYDIYGNDSYLRGIGVENVNPEYYTSEEGLELRNLSVDGYVFEGWYDGPGANATQIKRIAKGESGTKDLYAHWSVVEYTVQFKSSLFLEEDETTYTVDKGVVLPTPKLSNYVFTGWSDENGKLYNSKMIPAGTTGNITLTANWTSERNKTWTKEKLDAPIIHVDEESNVILFAYEIGEIQNVPLYTIKDFGYIAGDGVTKTESTTYSVTVSESAMQAYTKAVAKATTESSDWTLSSNWNEVTSVDEQWCQENGKTVEEAQTVAKSETDTWNISSGSSGSTETSTLSTNQDGWQNQVKINASSEHSESDKTTSNSAWNVNAKLTYTPKSKSFGIGVAEVGELSASQSGGWGGEVGGGYEHSWGKEHEETDTTQSGIELGGTKDHSDMTTDSTVNTSSWNSSSSYGGSSTNSTTVSNSTALSEKISKSYGYGQSYAAGGESGTSQGLSSTQSSSDEYSASVTYSTETSEQITSTWTTQATKPGYHRWVVAGTAHVFAVVGYDMSTKSYFVYTYSVMDEETHEFEDYSYTTASYNDEENGVIPFEIPYEVAEYVSELTSWSSGLKVNQTTGMITEYTGTDTCVVIPEYMNVGNGDVVKVTGISNTAFSGNTNIQAVVLSDYITEIPDSAFEGCTSLIGVTGGDVTKIGAKAFSGCVSAEDVGIRNKVTYLGDHAFDGVDRIIVNAANADIVDAAMNSGANKIILCLDFLENGAEEMRGKTLSVPEGTTYFEFNGCGRTYQDLTIISNAKATAVNKANFVSSGRIPLQISSPEVILNQVSVSASGLALVLTADHTNLGLQATIPVSSESTNAMLSKNVKLYEVNQNVEGTLEVSGKMLVCGEVEGQSHLTYTDYEKIDAEQFERLLHSYTLYFNANGGSCDEASREVANSTALGQLPTPTRQNYTFAGWYLADGTSVTEDTVFSSGLDQTVYAQWMPNSFKMYYDANGGSCGTSEKTLTYGVSVGTLAVPTRDYYTFEGWYTSAEGGEQITENTVRSNSTDFTVYAHWTQNEVSDWVLASEMPSDGAVVNTKWTYTQTTTTESRETSLSGYTQTGSYWVQSGSGTMNYSTAFPGGFNTSNWIYTSFGKGPYSAYENTTSKRVVSNSWAGYVYWHWMYNCGTAAAYDRRPYYQSGYNSENGFTYNNFSAFTSTKNYGSVSHSGQSGWTWYLIQDSHTSYAESGGSYYWYRFDYYTSNYTDYYKMFQYKKVENKESSVEVFSSDSISNIQKWVQYRPK